MLVRTDDHVPPVFVSVSVVLLPTVVASVPEIVPAVGTVIIFTICLAVSEPQVFILLYLMVSIPSTEPVIVADDPVEVKVASVLDALHVPPVESAISVMGEPKQTDVGPLMVPAYTSALTFTVFLATADPQVLVTVYLIVSVPAVTPVTTPSVLVALPVPAVDVHIPPRVLSVNVIVAPGQTLPTPPIAATVGVKTTVTDKVDVLVPQTLFTVYVIVSTPALLPPKTTPAADMVTFVFVADQVPPVVVLLSVSCVPPQTVVLPAIACAACCTVTICMSDAVPQLFVIEYVIVSAPCRVPVTRPVVMSIDAFALEALQVPPGVPLAVSVNVPATQSESPPLMVPTVGAGPVNTIGPTLAEVHPDDVTLILSKVPVINPVSTTLPEPSAATTALSGVPLYV